MAPDNIESPVRYPSDLSDEEWEILQPIFDELDPYTTGRPRTTDLREILNAIFYLNKTGCPWRYLPKDFPSYKVVNYHNNKWTDNRMLEKVNAALRRCFREKKDRTPDPTGAIIDSESVKGTPESVSVPAGQFMAVRAAYRDGTVWVSDQVPAMGLVKATFPSGTLELVRSGPSGAKNLLRS